MDTDTEHLSSPVHLHLVGSLSHPKPTLGYGTIPGGGQPQCYDEPLHAVRRADRELHSPAPAPRPRKREVVFVYPR